MVTPSVAFEDKLKAVRAVQEHGNISAASRHLKMDRCTLRRHYRQGLDDGLHLSSGARNSMELSGLQGVEVRGGHRRVYDEAGKQIDTVRWNAPDVDVEDVLDKIRAAFEDIPAAPAIIAPERVKENSVAFFPHQDWHIGSEASAERVGRAYNPQIAVERLKDGFSQCHAAIEPSEVAIILNNGDLTHGNDDTDSTPRHKHKLKITGTHEDNLTLSVHSTIWMIDTALERHGRVEYIANRGNHDPNTPPVLRLALTQRYRNDPRVKICQSQREMWVWQKGRLFLSAVHGDGLKPKDLAANIPPKYPREFGVSDYWYLFTGHYHSPESKLYGGIRHFQLPALCTIDPHADDLGYFDSSAMRAMRFDIHQGIKNDYTASL